MNRRDRIEVLLVNYIDVVNGLQDRNFRGDDFIPRMCRCWSHPSYVELERLRIVMRDAEPFNYWHLAETYFRASFRRVAYCPSCDGTAPAERIGSMHKHGQRVVSLVPRAVRVVSKAVNPKSVAEAVTWLDRNWVGDVFIPDDLLAIAA